MVRKHSQVKNVCVKAALACIVCCVKKCLNMFTGSLFVRVGLFGMNYLKAAKEVGWLGVGCAYVCVCAFVPVGGWGTGVKAVTGIHPRAWP